MQINHKINVTQFTRQRQHIEVRRQC